MPRRLPTGRERHRERTYRQARASTAARPQLPSMSLVVSSSPSPYAELLGFRRYLIRGGRHEFLYARLSSDFANIDTAPGIHGGDVRRKELAGVRALMA